MKPSILTATLISALAGPSFACGSVADPVVSLDYGSRYQDGDDSRSTLDATSNAEVDAALGPIDDFIRGLARDSNTVIREADTVLADCVMTQIASWAEAGALSDLGSFTARLSVGSRFAGIAFAYRNVRPYSTRPDQARIIEDWLDARIAEQIIFWEEEATPGAKVGNLRAWSSLATVLVADMVDNDAYRHWAAWSISNILCTARDDGSLPQETKRGGYALHYQLHAVAALVPTVLILQDAGIDLVPACNEALGRAVNFAVTDIAAVGAASAGYAGKPQTLFDDDGVQPHAMAWTVPYAQLRGVTPLAVTTYDPPSNSKLGGDQTLVWGMTPQN